MTIEEYKQKLDEYLGMVGVLEPDVSDKNTERYLIKYLSPSGVPMVKYAIVKAKNRTDNGWYESGSRTNFLPYFDPDTEANRQRWLKIREEQIRTST